MFLDKPHFKLKRPSPEEHVWFEGGYAMVIGGEDTPGGTFIDLLKNNGEIVRMPWDDFPVLYGYSFKTRSMFSVKDIKKYLGFA